MQPVDEGGMPVDSGTKVLVLLLCSLMLACGLTMLGYGIALMPNEFAIAFIGAGAIMGAVAVLGIGCISQRVHDANVALLIV